MRILRLLPVAALLVAASSCSTIKKGSQATWDAVSGAGAVVARGTSKTARILERVTPDGDALAVRTAA